MIEHQKMCFCWLPWGKVESYLKNTATKEEEERMQEIKQLWLEAHRKYGELVQEEEGMGKTVQIQEIPLEFMSRLEAVKNSEPFKKTFRFFPTYFTLVEIDKLVVLQHTVVMDIVERISSTLPEKIDMDALIKLCIENQEQTTPVKSFKTTPNSMVFTTDHHRSFRFLWNAEELHEHNIGGLPTHEFSFVFGYGHPAATAFLIDGRMYLNNGLHRAYALRARGVKYMPIIVQVVDDPTRFTTSFFGISKEHMLSAPRLPLLKEFFGEGLTLDFDALVKRRGVRLTWNVEEVEVIY